MQEGIACEVSVEAEFFWRLRNVQLESREQVSKGGLLINMIG